MNEFRRVAIMIDLQWPLRHHQDVFAGTQRYARDRGNWECTVDLHAGESLHAGRGRSAYDGVIARATLRLVARAKRAHVPVVNVWLNSPVRNVPAVLHDAAAAGRMAAEHLMARGLRQFGYAGYHRDRVTQQEMAAFRSTVAAAGFPTTTCLTSRDCDRTPATWKKSQAALEQWIETWPRPIGICVCHDVLARYLAAACQRKKVGVPEEAAIVSTSNELPICLHPEPSLSSIAFDFDEIGYRAAELLDRLMDGAKPPKGPLVIAPAELAARQSTDVFAVSDSVVARAMRYIAEHGDGPVRVGDVAAHVHTTRRTLERHFQSTVGRTMSEEIGRLRIERVKRQLVESKEPLKKIALRLGFRDDRRLCEAFRRIEGTTPGEYRRQRRKPAE